VATTRDTALFERGAALSNGWSAPRQSEMIESQFMRLAAARQFEEGMNGLLVPEVGRNYEAFSETDFTEDLKKIDVPTLVMHGDDDQIVPIAVSALLSSKLLRRGTLKVHQGFPHGMCTTHADVVNPELLAFIKS
jgi:pimeloyl-ACP methyl ester carboxylesterase